jgi:hypothetical protein
MTNLKRISFHAPDDIIAWLSSEAERTGVLVSEILRRMVRARMKAEDQND